METNNYVQSVPINHDGDLLFLKDFNQTETGQMTVKYKAGFNDIPFVETPVRIDGQFVVIPDGQGQVAFKFHLSLIQKILTPATAELYAAYAQAEQEQNVQVN